MNQDATRLRVKELEPGAPLDLAEARNAVALARLAGADRFATDTFGKAERLLTEAERAREGNRDSNAVMMPARQAVQTAEDARLIAVKKQEETYAAEQRAMLLRRETEALSQAKSEQARRQQAESERVAAEQRTSEATAAREAAERARAEANASAERLARERAAAESARAAAEARAQQAQSTAEQSEREKAELRAKLREQLALILETNETARGLIVNLSDVLFDTGRATLKPGAREKLAKVTGVLLAHPGLQIEVDGHTDSVGADAFNQRLSEQRAAAVRTYLVDHGIPETAVTALGFGEGSPVVSNNTAAGRQRNRRVELVVAGETIGVTTTTTIRR